MKMWRVGRKIQYKYNGKANNAIRGEVYIRKVPIRCNWMANIGSTIIIFGRSRRGARERGVLLINLIMTLSWSWI
jgi:hypothetical protein